MRFLFKNSKNKELNFGYIAFLVGLFLLPSALSIGIVFLLISCIFGLRKFIKNIENDRLNKIFYFGTFFLSLNALANFIINKEIITIPYKEIYSTSYLSSIGLLNWIPLIFAYGIFQQYLSTYEDRRRSAIALIMGSMPVFFSSFSQFLFDWDEILKTLYGFIVWYQKPLNLNNGISGISGLFSNPNYLAAWLIIIWPICLSFLLEKKKKIYKVMNILLIILVSILIVLSSSRAALFFLVLPLPIIYRSKFKKTIAIIIGFLFFLFLNLFLPIFGLGFQNFLRQMVPKGIWINFTQIEYTTKMEYTLSRLETWIETLKLISKKPLFGYGSNTFPHIFFNETGIWIGHSHNLPLELIFNYGIPTSLIILLPIVYLIIKSFKQEFILKEGLTKDQYLNRGWVLSLISIAGMHLVDIQYYDARISIIGWILLAGTRNIIKRE